MRLTDEEVMELLRASVEQSKASGALLTELRGGNNHTHVTYGGSNWIAVLCALIAIGCALYAADVKDDMRAEGIDRRAEDRWTRTEINTIRAYIHTGKLKPLTERKEAKE